MIASVVGIDGKKIKFECLMGSKVMKWWQDSGSESKTGKSDGFVLGLCRRWGLSMCGRTTGDNRPC